MDKLTIYNGKEWTTVEAEPVYKDGVFTGHFKQLNKESIDQFGIFDDVEIYQKAINDINDFRRNNIDTIYIAQGNNYLKLFSTYTFAPEYDNLGLAFMKFLESTGLLPQGYEISTFEGIPAILVQLKDKETEKKYIIRLTKGSNYISTIR